MTWEVRRGEIWKEDKGEGQEGEMVVSEMGRGGIWKGVRDRYMGKVKVKVKERWWGKMGRREIGKEETEILEWYRGRRNVE